jgi:hypothetical protein
MMAHRGPARRHARGGPSPVLAGPLGQDGARAGASVAKVGT